MRIFAIFVVLFLAGCVTQREWAATGGSRSDGIVRLSYEYSPYEQPQVQEEQGLALATQRCASWGYTGAEAFGGVTRRCSSASVSFYGGGCDLWLVTKEYQCIGQPENKNKSDN